MALIPASPFPQPQGSLVIYQEFTCATDFCYGLRVGDYKVKQVLRVCHVPPPSFYRVQRRG
ncbi:hypothetical protein C5167_009225 [Papaver somniferum]|uniref:Uncharacterized protein n=1 Tax=Papaver somniferum TaxID=3469 RepID=A0A4Y7K0N6_PAPSO|nr:hypothetical protein C5167_009225 [Papaver somniferum]